MRALSHVALTVGRGDGPIAARMLELLGFTVTDNGPSRVGEPWYTALVDAGSYGGGLEHLGFFVVPVSEAQVALEAAVRDRMAGAPEVGGYLAERGRKPDSNSHIAVTYRGLEELEAAVLGLRGAPELSGRVTVGACRPAVAPEALESRLDRSEVFGPAERVGYLSAGVQAFVQTDVVSAGLLFLGQSFELNYEVAP